MKKECSICNYEILTGEKSLSIPEKKITICEKCIENAYFQLNEDIKVEKVYSNFNKELQDINNLSPIDLHKKLDNYIIGQDETKKTLSVAIYKHILRNNMFINKEHPDTILKKSNILLIGKSGSGKTLLAETISKILNVPFVIADATSLTIKGYSGGDVEDILKRLIVNANGDIKKAEQGIVFIDEIDKISIKSSGFSSKDINGQGVQDNLLKIIEGTKVYLKENNPLTSNNIATEIDTTNILFIFGGAFSELENIDNNIDNTVGFLQNNIEDNNKNIINNLLEYGFTPEFLGRIPIITYLHPLSKEDLLDIIIKPNNSILTQYKVFFEKHNITIEFSEDSLNYIVDNIQKNTSGARYLQKIFETIFEDIVYHIEEFKNNTILINKDYINSKNKRDLMIEEK